MDFDSCFADGCKSCNSASQNYRSPTSGQGDFKCSGEVQDQNYWGCADKGKKFKSKIIRDKDKVGLKEERQKNLMDVGCNCFTKCSKKQECGWKPESKQEKSEPEIFENCSGSWNNLISNSWKSQLEKFYVSEERKYGDHATEKLLTGNVLELEDKVNFLFRIIKDSGCRLANEGYTDSMQMKAGGTVGDAWHLFHLNKRLCAAEEGIEKLALILEELLKEWSKKKGVFQPEESMTFSEPLDFEEMSMVQRINFLKNRNDMLLGLIKAFLTSGSAEDMRSRLSSLPDEHEPKPTVLSPKPHFGGTNQSKEITREGLMETFKNLQVNELPKKTEEEFNEHPSKRRTKRGLGLKFPGTKLEIISEQAELALSQSDESLSAAEDFQRKNGGRNLKGKFSQVSEDPGEDRLGLCDVTSRLLAREAMLKSSLDKVHLELLSKLDSSEKNYLKAGLNILNGIQTPLKEETDSDFETRFEPSSDVSWDFSENESPEMASNSEVGKFARHDEFKEPVQEEKPPCKDFARKKSDEQMTPKNKFGSKILQKNGCSVLGSLPKPPRANCCLTDLCPSGREGTRPVPQTRDQRPLTAPTSLRKSLPAGPRPPPSEKTTRKGSGINSNVRNKNKILLSKKSFVQTP